MNISYTRISSYSFVSIIYGVWTLALCVCHQLHLILSKSTWVRGSVARACTQQRIPLAPIPRINLLVPFFIIFFHIKVLVIFSSTHMLAHLRNLPDGLHIRWLRVTPTGVQVFDAVISRIKPRELADHVALHALEGVVGHSLSEYRLCPFRFRIQGGKLKCGVLRSAQTSEFRDVFEVGLRRANFHIVRQLQLGIEFCFWK